MTSWVGIWNPPYMEYLRDMFLFSTSFDDGVALVKLDGGRRQGRPGAGGEGGPRPQGSSSLIRERDLDPVIGEFWDSEALPGWRREIIMRNEGAPTTELDGPVVGAATTSGENVGEMSAGRAAVGNRIPGAVEETVAASIEGSSAPSKHQISDAGDACEVQIGDAGDETAYYVARTSGGEHMVDVVAEDVVTAALSPNMWRV